MRPCAGDLAPLAGPARQLGRAQQSARRGGASGMGGHPPGTALGRPPSALRARLKTNRPGNCGGQPARRVAAHARPTCTHAACTHAWGAPPRPPAPSVSRLPGLLGWGPGPEERRGLTHGLVRPWRADGWTGGGWGDLSELERDGRGRGPRAKLSAKGRAHSQGVGQGGGEPVAVAAMGRGVWETHPSIAQRQAEEARDPSGESEGGHGPFSGGHPWACCSHRGDAALSSGPDPVSSVGSVCLWGRRQGEGSWPTCCWGAPAEEKTCSYLGEL